MRLGDVRAGQVLDGDPGREGVATFLADGLALAGGEGGEEVVEARVAVVLPVELLVGALQEAGGLRPVRTRPARMKVTWIEDALVSPRSARRPATRPAVASSGSAPGAIRKRGPVTGVNGTLTWSFG